MVIAVYIAVFKAAGVMVYEASLGKYAQGQQNITLSLRLDPGAYVLKLIAGDKVYQSVVIRK